MTAFIITFVSLLTLAIICRVVKWKIKCKMMAKEIAKAQKSK